MENEEGMLVTYQRYTAQSHTYRAGAFVESCNLLQKGMSDKTEGLACACTLCRGQQSTHSSEHKAKSSQQEKQPAESRKGPAHLDLQHHIVSTISKGNCPKSIEDAKDTLRLCEAVQIVLSTRLPARMRRYTDGNG